MQEDCIKFQLSITPTGQPELDIAIAKKAIDELYFHAKDIPIGMSTLRTCQHGGFYGDTQNRDRISFQIFRKSNLDFQVQVRLRGSRKKCI